MDMFEHLVIVVGVGLPLIAAILYAYHVWGLNRKHKTSEPDPTYKQAIEKIEKGEVPGQPAYRVPLIGYPELKVEPKPQYQYEAEVVVKTSPSKVTLTVVAADPEAAKSKIRLEMEDILRRNNFIYDFKVMKIEKSEEQEEKEQDGIQA
jgi:hypothetical protein